MYKRNFDNSAHLRHVVRYACKYGQKGSFPIDQLPSQSQNVDPATGRPMSDIQKLVKIQDAVNQQAFFSSLREFKSNFLPQGTTNEQAIMFLKSRNVQTKSELLDYKTNFAKWQLQQDEFVKQAELRKQREDYAAALFEQMKNDSKSD